MTLPPVRQTTLRRRGFALVELLAAFPPCVEEDVRVAVQGIRDAVVAGPQLEDPCLFVDQRGERVLEALALGLQQIDVTLDRSGLGGPDRPRAPM